MTTYNTLIKEHNKNKDDIVGINEQLADIITNLNLVDGTDCTTEIQKALDKKGWIKIPRKGVYYISKTLLIDSDTVFELCDGAELRLAPGTRDYLIKNKNQTTGNENITITGGKWNINRVENNEPTNQWKTGWPGHGVFIWKAKNIKFKDMFVTGCPKYCFLIVDTEDVVAKNISFNNDSDGLHFQPPLKKAFIENITGYTNDDMISFTIGDYEAYNVSNIGDMEDIYINNVVSNNAKSLIKLTGSGEGYNYKFKNFTVNNLLGTIKAQGIAIIDDGDSLPNTKVENFTASNVKLKGGTNAVTYISAKYCKDITIRDISVESTSVAIGVFSPGIIDNLNVFGLKALDSVTPCTNKLIKIWGECKKLTINDADVYVSGGGTLLDISGSVTRLALQNINLEGINTKGLGLITYQTLNDLDAYFSNVKIDNVDYIFYATKKTSTSKINLAMYNCIFDNISGSGIYLDVNSVVRITGRGIRSTLPFLKPYLHADSSATISIDVPDWKINDLTKLTPQAWDEVYCTTTPLGKIVWDGSIWRNI